MHNFKVAKIKVEPAITKIKTIRHMHCKQWNLHKLY